MAISEKGKKRYELIVKTALDLFLKNGYEKLALAISSQLVAARLLAFTHFLRTKRGFLRRS